MITGIAARVLARWRRGAAIFKSEASPTREVREEICQCVKIADALRIVDTDGGALADLAKQSGITAENAAVRVHRARKALHKRLLQACGTCAEHGCLDCRCRTTGGGCCH